jgi:hypothetical protein
VYPRVGKWIRCIHQASNQDKSALAQGKLAQGKWYKKQAQGSGIKTNLLIKALNWQIGCNVTP